MRVGMFLIILTICGLATLASNVPAARAQATGDTFEGPIEGGGTIRVEISAASQVEVISLEGFPTPCVTITDTFPLDPPVPVRDMGNSFNTTIRPGPDTAITIGAYIDIAGVMHGDVSWETTGTPGCNVESQPFTATRVAAATAVPAAPTTAASTATSGAAALPSTGSGTAGGGGLAWLGVGSVLVLCAAAAALTLRRGAGVSS